MNKYAVEKLRNICIMAHSNEGKTSFVEAMLFNTKAVERLGKVADGTSNLDYDPEEIKRKSSINAATTPIEWKGIKYNVIDTPGYFDFVGEVMSGISAADSAIILANARSGVSVGTEKSWDYAKEKGIPIMFFINKMDDENANFQQALKSLQDSFGSSVAPFQYPVYEGGKFVGYIDIINLKAYKYDKQGAKEIAFTDQMKDEIEEVRGILMEAIAETDEELMEKFFSEEEFTIEEINKALKSGVREGLIVPVFIGAATNNQGVIPAFEACATYFPAPCDAVPIKAKDMKADKECTLEAKDGAPLAALVFKTIADPFVGKLSIFRVFQGEIKSDMQVYNASKQTNEKIGKLFLLRGKKQIETSSVGAGDIGAVAKLTSTGTSDTLCSAANPIEIPRINFPKPTLSLAVVPKAKGDEEKIGTGLTKLTEEDATFNVENNVETRQMLISGVGDQHLEVIVNKLKNKFGVSVDLIEPICAYRETIRSKVRIEGKHKKQSGGHGQYGHVWIEFEPGESEDLTFEEKIFGGAVPRNYFPAVEKGLRESCTKGVLAGYPLVNLKATLVDGSYHPVDSSEMAFKIAASLAYKEGVKKANPVLLEPIGHLEVQIPDTSMGDVVGDINKRRGRILGMNPTGRGMGEVTAEVPMAEMFKYATDLRSMTQARGKFSLTFERYEEAPGNVAQKVIEAAKAREEE